MRISQAYIFLLILHDKLLYNNHIRGCACHRFLLALVGDLILGIGYRYRSLAHIGKDIAL